MSNDKMRVQVRTLEARFHCNMNMEKSKVNRLVNRHISKETCFTIKSITYSSLCGPNQNKRKENFIVQAKPSCFFGVQVSVLLTIGYDGLSLVI